MNKFIVMNQNELIKVSGGGQPGDLFYDFGYWVASLTKFANNGFSHGHF